VASVFTQGWEEKICGLRGCYSERRAMNGCDGIFYCTVIHKRYNCDMYVLRGGNVDVGLVEPFYLGNAS
jgi:hypothetical protein